MNADATHFAIWAGDRPGMLEERTRVREAHRARLKAGAPGLRVVLAGPTTDLEGRMNGTLLVVEATDLEQVRAFVAGDPYVQAGVYDPARVEIRPWRWSTGQPALPLPPIPEPEAPSRSTPCIISVAITGSLPRKKDNPAVPVTVSEQVEATHAAYEAGASLVHLHVRNDDESPTSAPERFAQVLEGIRRHCPDIITQVSTGGRSGAGRERGAMLHLRPDMASLATGSVNFPTRVYDNPPELVDWLAEEMRTCGIKPEIEAFDLSMVFQAVAMQRAGKIAGPLHLQFIMGIKNAMPADREVLAFYVRTLRRLAPEATWTGAGIGREQLTLARWSLELGGHCRTGLEDNVRLDKHTLAPSNAALVTRIAGLCGEYGRAVARPLEARALLGLAAPRDGQAASTARSGTVQASGR